MSGISKNPNETSNGIKRFFCWVRLAQNITWIFGGITLILFFLISIKINAFEKNLERKHLNPIKNDISMLKGQSNGRNTNIAQLDEKLKYLQNNTVNKEMNQLKLDSINEKLEILTENQKMLLIKFDKMKDEVIGELKKNSNPKP